MVSILHTVVPRLLTKDLIETGPPVLTLFLRLYGEHLHEFSHF